MNVHKVESFKTLHLKHNLDPMVHVSRLFPNELNRIMQIDLFIGGAGLRSNTQFTLASESTELLVSIDRKWRPQPFQLT